MKLDKYSFGVGDRFARQGKAQLTAFITAKSRDIEIVPVWNKSCREHRIIGTSPVDVRKEADQAVEALNWEGAYYVDADHINMETVDSYIEPSDFFTLDVADHISKAAPDEELEKFIQTTNRYAGILSIPNIQEKFEIAAGDIYDIGRKFLFAVKEAGRIYRHIEQAKGADNFITEVSMDETDAPQSPVELFFILLMIAEENVPAQTIAPKFTGRFNKGVDYVGDIAQFEKEFIQDLAVIQFAVKEFGLPENLKLSIHSGSDKFSIYGPVNRAIKKYKAGLHIKTAGTTWLEEVIALASAGGAGLETAKRIYAGAYERFDELCGPYATVIDIDRAALPSVEQVRGWTSQQYSQAVTHDSSCTGYNLSVRQLLHVGYKVAAEMGDEYIETLEQHEEILAEHVSENIFGRHLNPIFSGLTE